MVMMGIYQATGNRKTAAKHRQQPPHINGNHGNWTAKFRPRTKKKK